MSKTTVTVEETTTAHPGASLDDGEIYPMRQLFLRIGAAYAEDG